MNAYNYKDYCDNVGGKRGILLVRYSASPFTQSSNSVNLKS